MLLNLLEYYWAEQIDDALIMLSRPDIRTVPVAGGTYLLGLRDDSIQAVVDLRDLALAYITEDARAIHIGAMTTLQSMVDSPMLKALAHGILARAAHASSFSRLIRNAATLGGTLGAWTASQADLLTVLVAMDAEVFLRSGEQTQVNLSGGTPDHPGLALPGVIFKGKHERHVPFSAVNSERRSNELIVEVAIPRPASGSGASFMRVGRTPTDVALLNAVALVEVNDGVYSRVRVALGGVNMEPVRLPGAERQLQGMSAHNGQDIFAALQAAMSEFQPPSDFRASSDYRQASGLHLAYRALEEATNRAGGKASFEGGM